MNLQTDISEIRGRLPEYYADEEVDERVQTDEIVDWFNQAEYEILKDLPAPAMVDSSLSAVSSSNLSSGDLSKTMPTDAVKLVSVSVDLNNVGFKRPCIILPYEQFILWRSNPNVRPSMSKPLAAFYGGTVYFAPAAKASVTGGLEVRYIKKPTRRYKHFRGSITDLTGITEFTDTKTVAAGFPADFFNSCGLKMTSGASRNEEQTVSDFTAAGVFTMATGFSALVIGETYEVGDASAIPERFRPLVLEYVSFLARLKDDDERAAAHLNEYKRRIAELSGRLAPTGGSA